MCFGYAGLRYRITAAGTNTITVERLTDTGAVDEHWPGFDPLTSRAISMQLDDSTTEGDWAGPFTACPEGEVSAQIAWDVMFPGGLCFINDGGVVSPRAVTVETQYRNMATAGAWTSIQKTYTQQSLDQVGFTEREFLPTAIAMRAEVRMRRIGAKSTSTQVQDVVQWYGLRSQLHAPARYDGVTVLALRLRGGNRLASQSENLVSLEPTRILPVRSSGAPAGEQPTRDIAPWVLYIAKAIGYTEVDIDMTELDRLDAIWRARGDTFDLVIDDATTVKDALADVLRAGFAEFTVDRGRIRPVRDEPRTVFEQMYTPQNMTQGLVRRFTARRPDDYDGVDVEYMDARSWQKETVQCRLPGDQGRKVLKISLDGVTDRTRAWRRSIGAGRTASRPSSTPATPGTGATAR